MKSKSSKKTDAPKPGKLGGLFGFSLCAVLRKLGKEGFTPAHVRDIMKAMKVKVSPTTISIQLSRGRSGDGELAELTAAQLTELKKAAPEPK